MLRNFAKNVSSLYKFAQLYKFAHDWFNFPRLALICANLHKCLWIKTNLPKCGCPSLHNFAQCVPSVVKLVGLCQTGVKCTQNCLSLFCFAQVCSKLHKVVQMFPNLIEFAEKRPPELAQRCAALLECAPGRVSQVCTILSNLYQLCPQIRSSSLWFAQVRPNLHQIVQVRHNLKEFSQNLKPKLAQWELVPKRPCRIRLAPGPLKHLCKYVWTVYVTYKYCIQLRIQICHIIILILHRNI